MDEQELIKYFKLIGLDVHTKTKARGHQGFYLKNRIDISKNLPQDRVIPTLIHEFAHYVHSLIEPFMEKTGGSLSVIFNDKQTSKYENELITVTHFVDKNSKFEKLNTHKTIIKNRILECENIIKLKYPQFMRSKDFKEFDKYIKKTDARFLLKYDRVKLLKGFLFKKYVLLSVDKLEEDFPEMPEELIAYIRLKSLQRRQGRISSKINRLNKYYLRPTELFARFVEGLYIDIEQVKTLAPYTYNRFYKLLNDEYYPHLGEVLKAGKLIK